MISQFPRGAYSQIAITLTSNETLGILDSGYLEDWDGNDGQLSLYHAATNTRYPLLLTEVISETPTVSKDVFRGFFALAGKPDGLYAIQGRIRDIAGNYTILSAIANPNGTEQILELGIEIISGYGIIKTEYLKLEGTEAKPIVLEGLRTW